MGNIITITILLFLVFCVIHYQYTKKKRKKENCGEGCIHCPFHNDCHNNKTKVQ
ncbi:FeoB-associated Cys-rich membrane protein [Clostridium sp. MD294]|uniref:FeoB-associated Cys-rich membrane protein n=1 Tax=Clostridium sp. MD294 TaxID=97138 RepID=UPI00039A28E1|nr:FeoB-associated Cys-rich membrane protein [Clostridium sp. MD294]